MGDLEKRRDRLYAYLDREGIDLYMIEDCEERRNSSLRYLSGHPMDGLLFLQRRGKATLMPWDVSLAERHAAVDEILPYNDFGRRPLSGLIGFLESPSFTAPAKGFTVEADSNLPYPLVSRIMEETGTRFPGSRLVCREGGAGAFIDTLRIVKDTNEILLLKKAAGIADRIIDGIEKLLRTGDRYTESDIALFIEKECRALGAEGTSFETIAAGPERSWGIHAFPGYGSGPFCAPGLSILDFGVRRQGYAADVTLTLVTGKISPRQKLLIGLVEEAYNQTLELCVPGGSTLAIARKAEEIFARRGLLMPHALGHGLGLDVHEAPFIRNREDSDTVLEPGMVFTLEPGLYDPEAGGVRLENDILITDTGREVLTNSRILYKE
jgi:Xaa-Pro dipeptidase